MTCSGFYQLTYHQQADLLLQEGTFLQTCTESDYIIDLYEIQDLFIEIFYHKDNNEPVSVMAYNTVDKLKTLKLGNLKPRLTFKNSSGCLAKASFAA